MCCGCVREERKVSPRFLGIIMDGGGGIKKEKQKRLRRTEFRGPLGPHSDRAVSAS